MKQGGMEGGGCRKTTGKIKAKEGGGQYLARNGGQAKRKGRALAHSRLLTLSGIVDVMGVEKTERR